MNSYNHYAYGAVCQWLFEGVAGFRPDPELPGFRRIVFEPTILPRSASCGRATTRPPGGSRRPGRSRTARSTTRSACRRAPRACWCSACRATVDGRRSTATGRKAADLAPGDTHRSGCIARRRLDLPRYRTVTRMVRLAGGPGPRRTPGTTTTATSGGNHDTSDHRFSRTVAATTLTIASAGLAQEVTLTMLIRQQPGHRRRRPTR